MEQQPLPPLQTPPTTRPKLPLIGGAVLALALLGLGIWWVMDASTPQQSAVKTPVTEFTAGTEAAAHTYANNKMIDACNLVSLDTVKRVVPRYDEGLKTLNTDVHPPRQYSIIHRYVDRDIATALEQDAKPQQRQIIVTPDGTNRTETLESYLSDRSSYCAYHQGELVFLKVFVVQPPTPLSPELLAYLAAKPANQVQTVGQLTLYKEVRVADGPYTGLLVNADKTRAVTLQTATEELFIAGAEEIASKLEDEPAGAFTLQYPEPYTNLVNPCPLLPAADFERFNKQPARATAEEKLIVTKSSNDPVLERGCVRIGVSSDPNKIAQSDIYIVQFPTVERAQQYTRDEQTPEALEQNSLKPTSEKLGDESFTTLNERDNVGYVVKVRVGAAIVVIRNEPDTSRDNSQEDFDKRIMPLAKAVIENYHKQIR